MAEIIAGILVLLGATFAFVAGVGLVRLPDLFMRMHAASKAGTLAAGLILVAVAVTSNETGVLTRAIAAIVFLLLTAPVAAHVLGRAAYLTGVPMWKGTAIDEWRKRPDGTSEDPSQPETDSR